MKKLLPIIFILLLAGNAWGETYWVDLAGTGTGAADGSDVSNLCAGLADGDCSPSAGDIIKLCNTSSTTQSIATAAGGTVTYDFECTGGTDGLMTSTSGAALSLTTATNDVIFDNPQITTTGSGTWGVNVNGATNITFRGDGVVSGGTWVPAANGLGVIGPTLGHGLATSNTNDADNITLVGIEVANTGGTGFTIGAAASGLDYSGIEIDDCYFHDNGDASGEGAIRLKGATSSTATITAPSIHDTIIEDAYDYGIDLHGGNSSMVSRILDPDLYNLRITNCGQIGPDTGVGGGAIRIWNGGPSVAATATPWIWDSVLNANIGNGGGVVLLYSSYGIIEDTESSNNVIESNQYDGGGFDIDHDCDNITVRRVKAKGNLGTAGASGSGYGIMVLDSSNISVETSVFDGNRLGISYNPNFSGSPVTDEGADNSFSNLTVINSTVYGIIVEQTASTNTGTFRNIGIYNNPVGFYIFDNDSDQDVDYCNYYGNSTARTNQDAGANDTTTDPALNMFYAPPALISGTDVSITIDYYGRTIASPWIGAVGGPLTGLGFTLQ